MSTRRNDKKRDNGKAVMKNQDMLAVEYVRLQDLVPYPDNPRDNAPAVDPCAASIRAFGFGQPIIIDQDNVIVCGHTRRLAAMKIGLAEVPCIRMTDLTPEQLRAFRLVDNKVAELSTWDESVLQAEIAELSGDFNFETFGFDLDQFTLDDAELDAQADTTEDTFDVDVAPLEIRVKRGEMWRLGDHILLCGDSTTDDVTRVMGGENADAWITDPPYNVNYGERGEQYKKMSKEEGKQYKCGKDSRKILNDNMDDASFRRFLVAVSRQAAGVLRPGAPFYICHSDTEGYNFMGACRDADLKVRQMLVWEKDQLVLGRQDYQYIHEPVIYGWKDGATHEWYGDRKQTTVITMPRPKKSELHPTMKPIELMAYFMKNSTKRGDIVLETFGGSGTTLIAAERMGRRCRCIELDERYATVIVNRWEEDTGRKAVRIEPVTEAKNAT